MSAERFGDFWLQWHRDNFTEQLEALKEVHTEEELEDQKLRLATAKDDLMRNDSTFVEYLDKRKRMLKQQSAGIRDEVGYHLRRTATIVNDPSEYGVPSRGRKVVCCPECLRLDAGNKTSPLNRKQRRKHPKVRGYQVHKSAFCFDCNVRMVTMLKEDRNTEIAKKRKEMLR